MCFKRRRPEINNNQLSLIVGQYVYVVTTNYQKGKNNTEYLKLELAKARVTECTQRIDSNSNKLVVTCEYILQKEDGSTIARDVFTESAIGSIIFTNIDDAIRKAGECIGQTCFGKEIE